MHLCRILLFALPYLAATASMHADTLASQLPNPIFGSNTANYFGESFIVDVFGLTFMQIGNGSYNSIAFSFLTPSGTTYATGTGFLLSQVYTGTPGALSSATAGYLGSASASGGSYSFNNSIVLTAGTQYYFYENALIPANTIGSGGAAAILQPDNSYTASTGSFAKFGFTNPFLVTGNSVTATPVSATPEPSSFALLGTGVLGVAGGLRRRLLLSK